MRADQTPRRSMWQRNEFAPTIGAHCSLPTLDFPPATISIRQRRSAIALRLRVVKRRSVFFLAVLPKWSRAPNTSSKHLRASSFHWSFRLKLMNQDHPNYVSSSRLSIAEKTTPDLAESRRSCGAYLWRLATTRTRQTKSKFKENLPLINPSATRAV